MSANLLCAVVRKIGAGRHCSKYPITSSSHHLVSGTSHSHSNRTRTRRIHLGSPMAEHQDPNQSSKPLSKQAIKTMTDEDWAKRLTAEQFYVTREAGTEAPFTGKYYKYDQDGIYTCVCCGAALFSSKAKYDSGCGWPSFSETLKQAEADGEETGILKRNDLSHGMVRIECICKNCNAHLGHVFDDGPTETKERYCINSAALKFQPKKM